MNEIEKLQNEIEQLKVAMATVKNEWQSEKFYFQELEKSFEQKINNLPYYDLAVKIVKRELDLTLIERNQELRAELVEMIEFEVNKKIVLEIEKINQIIEQLPDKLSKTKQEIFKHLDNLKTMAAAVKIADYELQKFFEDNYYEDYR